MINDETFNAETIAQIITVNPKLLLLPVKVNQPLSFKPLQWSEEREPNESIRYNHVTVDTAIGQFSIEWKGWKLHDSFCVYVNEEYLHAENTLEKAKEFVVKYSQTKVIEILKESISQDCQYNFIVDDSLVDKSKTARVIEKAHGIKPVSPFDSINICITKHVDPNWVVVKITMMSQGEEVRSLMEINAMCGDTITLNGVAQG